MNAQILDAQRRQVKSMHVQQGENSIRLPECENGFISSGLMMSISML
jgi:hypothetical protein